MKSSVIREMTTEEVQDALLNERESLSKMKMQHAISPLENPMVLKEKRKDVSRLLTELTKRSKEAQQ
jgi:large subunit ribosomal protein L29